jgi:hypothetical protein
LNWILMTKIANSLWKKQERKVMWALMSTGLI